MQENNQGHTEKTVLAS